MISPPFYDQQAPRPAILTRLQESSQDLNVSFIQHQDVSSTQTSEVFWHTDQPHTLLEKDHEKQVQYHLDDMLIEKGSLDGYDLIDYAREPILDGNAHDGKQIECLYSNFSYKKEICYKRQCKRAEKRSGDSTTSELRGVCGAG